MQFSALTIKQAKDVLRAAIYVSVSAGLDLLISRTTGTEFGTLTPIINVALVFVKKLLTDATKEQ